MLKSRTSLLQLNLTLKRFIQVLLHCWTESNRKGASLRAENIFRKMKNRYMAGEREECPDCIAYSIVLNKFAQENMYEAAEGILFEMVQDFLSGNDSAQPRTSTFDCNL
jgi:pentatricopeptide repeat protein